MNKKLFYIVLVCLSIIPILGNRMFDKDLQTKKETGLNYINKNSLINTVSYLASPELEGRLAGSPGYYKAANYASTIFNKIGLKPINDKSYYQFFNVEYNEINEPILFKIIGDKKSIEYKLGADYVLRGFTGSGNLTADVVFCGYGLCDPAKGYDDYAGIDVKGKIVMVFKYNPKWKIGDTDFGNGNPREKSAIAAQHGAVGILFVSLPNDIKPQKTIGSTIAGSGEQDLNFPQLHIDLHVADDLLKNSGKTLKKLQTKIDSLRKPFSINLLPKAQIMVTAKYTKEQKTMNIIGVLPGSDEKLKNEYVILSAHLDHVGKQGNSIYFPGANDNASGSAALLEIAKAFQKAEIKPKRTIVFILFSSEEAGLLGAINYVNNPIFPLEKTVAILNMDCIGYGDSIQLGNGKSAPNLWNLAKEIDKNNANFTVENTWNGGGADASPFHDKGIPALYFVTTNSYEHLHYMTDTPETLNQPLFENITKLAYLTIYDIAMGNYKRETVIK
ncbi:MAG: M20/M25/M40 family metallo-hydrolase [bacterium]